MLTEHEVETYRRNGLLSGVAVASEDEIRRFREAFDALEAEEGRDKSSNKLLDRHFDRRLVWELATHPKILDCVTALIGPDVFLLATHFFCKYGPSEGFVAWHQDVRYWGLEPPVEVSAWYAVDDSTRANGCMRVIPGLHRDHLLEHGKSKEAGNLLSINQQVEIDADEEKRAVDCVLKAGEMSLHDGMLVHGSLPNRSPRRRCGLTIRYIPTTVRPIAAGPIGTDLSWRPILVHGADRGGHFDLADPPFP